MIFFSVATVLAMGLIFFSGINFSFDRPQQNPKIISQSNEAPIVLGEQTLNQPQIATTPAPSTPVSVLLEKSALYSLINAHRKEQNLSTLRTHTALELSAKKKLEEMRATKYWQHENQDGVINWEIFEQSGYHYALAGENLSFANNSPWDVFSSWVDSPTHNQQLLTPDYEDMGIAIDCESYQEAGQQKCAVVLHLGRQQL